MLDPYSEEEEVGRGRKILNPFRQGKPTPFLQFATLLTIPYFILLEHVSHLHYLLAPEGI